MPLNEKGKKILASMKKQYGTKKGESVFYAMENSGKLRKVLKARGGKDASQADFGGGTPGPGDTGGAGGRDDSTSQFGNKGSSPTSTGGGTPTALSFSQTTSPNNVSLVKSFIPLSTQLVGKVADMVTEGYRTKKAKGENFLSKQVTLPSTRDYYKTTGKQLDVMSPEGKQYLQDDNRIPKTNKLVSTGVDNNSNNTQLCPDGSAPPCKTPGTQLSTMTPKSNFLSGFQAYEDGGEVIISNNVDKDLL